MKVDHVALWVGDLEGMRSFYETYFGCTANEKYRNAQKSFQSYFLSFENGCRIELMHNPDITANQQNYDKPQGGLVHLAVSVGSKAQVDGLTNQLRSDGYQIVGEPRTTGDGYYESVVLDPENNVIEITV